MSCTFTLWKNASTISILCSLILIFTACGEPFTTSSNEEGATNTKETEATEFTLTADEQAIITEAYGEMTAEEWKILLANLSELTAEELVEWLSIMTDYAENHSNDEYLTLGLCSGYYGSRIGYGWFDYSDSSNYSNLWSTNCYFWNANQCGNDVVVSFWMGLDYRGNQSLLKAYASSSTARTYLKYWEGGYSGDIYQGGSYYNAYMCWPWQLYYSKEQAQLKQLK